MARNPKWTKDEHLLALDLYFRAGRKWLPPEHDDVISLSDLLNSLPFHASTTRDEKFRNPVGVSMKLGNFLSVDPQYEGEGLKRGSKLEQEVWDIYSDDFDELSKVSEAIKNNLGSVLSTLEQDDDMEFKEGKILTRVHQVRERNPSVVRKKKKEVLDKKGKLECEACGFDFFSVYGDLGYGFAECHHTVPVSELGENQRTKFSDLVILCANCHRMIHKSKPMLSINGLKDILSNG